MVDEKEKTKSIEKAFEILKDIRKDISQTDRLIRLLEDVKKIKQYYNDQYEQFYQIYLVMLLEDKISDQLKREIMYVAYGLLQGFENDKTIQDRHRLYAQKAYGINTYIKQWKNPDDSLSKYENTHIISKLAEDLIEDALTNEQSKGILGFADEVIKNLSERFSEGIYSVLPLPEPKFVKEDSGQKGCQRAQEKINDDIDEIPKELSADDFKEDILSGGSSTDFASNDESHEKENLNKGNQYIRKETKNNHTETTYSQEGDKININHKEDNIINNDQITIININPPINPTENDSEQDVIDDTGKHPSDHMPLRWKIGIVLIGVIGICSFFLCICLFIKLNLTEETPQMTEDVPLVDQIYVFDNDFELMTGYPKELGIVYYPREADIETIHCVSLNPELVTINGHTVIAKPGWQEDANHVATIIVQGGDAEPCYVTVTIIPSFDDKAKDGLPNSEIEPD